MAEDEEAHIQRILERMLESGFDAEECCHDSPELLPAVRRRWAQIHVLDAEIEAFFPRMEPNPGIRSEPVTWLSATGSLPQIPGYEIQAVLGRGGMGIVYRAQHVRLRRPVALKMLLGGAFASEIERVRFSREAEAIAKLQHPHIVQVYDSGEHEGRPFFTMELMEGGTLASALAGTPQPASKAASLVAVLAGAVQAAHRAGIVHRDLKPGNVLLAPDGSPKISDFGLAHSIEGDHALTISGMRVGTPAYMAPEQAVGKPGTVGPAADIYALGAILYEALTGRPPFKGESPADTERQLISQEPVPPSKLNPKVARDLETICLKCLQKDPTRRYGTAADLAADLDRFQRGVPVLARRTSPFERALKWARRRPVAATVIGVVVAGVCSGAIVALRMQYLANARHTEQIVREARAREAVETGLSLVDNLREEEHWVEASHIIEDARSRLPDANSPDLAARLDHAASDLQTAQELEARSLVARKEYRDAVSLYGKAFEVDPRDDSDTWFEYASAQLLANDGQGYRRACAHMLERGEAGKIRAFLIARAYTLASCPPDDLQKVVALSANELNLSKAEYWSMTEQAALQCRLGHFDQAVPLLQRSIAANPKPAAAVVNWLWLAIANQKLGRADESRQWLQKATAWLDQLGETLPPNSGETSFHLHNWLEAQVLRRELTDGSRAPSTP